MIIVKNTYRKLSSWHNILDIALLQPGSMKNKDLSSKGEKADSQKKNPGIKKLGDKIGPVQNDPNSKPHPKENKRDDRQHEGEKRNSG